MCKNITTFLALTLVLAAINAVAYEDGDALQVQCYRVAGASDRPDVTDGLIAASSVSLL